MKKPLTALFSAITALSTCTAFAQTVTPAITQTVGTGSNESYFVINFEDGPGGTSNPTTDFAFGYRWNPASSPTGNDMMLALKADTAPQFQVYESTDPTYGLFISGFSYAGTTQTGASDPNGYWAYWTGTDGQSWTYSAIGAGDRPLTDGSWDGWTWDNDYADNSALLAPVTPAAAPEPSSEGVLAIGVTGLGILAFRRRRFRQSA